MRHGDFRNVGGDCSSASDFKGVIVTKLRPFCNPA